MTTGIEVGKLYTDKDVAAFLCVSIFTIYSWRQKNKPRPMAIKVGGLPRTSGQAILDYLKKCQVA